MRDPARKADRRMSLTKPSACRSMCCEKDRDSLGQPLGLDVLKAGWTDDREADQEDVGLGVRKGTQSAITTDINVISTG